MNNLNRYIQDARQFNLLSKDEERDLIKRKLAGDKEAEKLLVQGNLRLAILIAKEFTRSGCDLEDLVEEANIGLIIGVSKYQDDRGAKLGYYCAMWMRAQLRAFTMRNKSLVRIGVGQNQRKLYYKFASLVDDICSFDKEAIAEKLEVSVKDVESFCQRMQTNVSLESEGTKSLVEGLSDENAVSPEEAAQKSLFGIDALIEAAKLTDDEAAILDDRYLGKGLSREATAKERGMKAREVLILETNALTKLRNTATTKGLNLMDFLSL